MQLLCQYVAICSSGSCLAGPAAFGCHFDDREGSLLIASDKHIVLRHVLG